jgi:hypothetical protein
MFALETPQQRVKGEAENEGKIAGETNANGFD